MSRGRVGVSLVWILLVAGALPASAADISVGAALGYDGGIGGRVFGITEGFAKGFPLAAEIGFGFGLKEPGDAAKARKVFINDNTNGSPEEYGLAIVSRLDFWYDTRWLKEGRISLGGGLRHSFFRAHFKYVGGNEDFDVTTSQWGAGFGARATFSMAPRLDLVLGATLDYFFDAPLEAHSRAYKPNGDDVDPRPGETYSTADAVIEQPKLSPAVVIGISYKL